MGVPTRSVVDQLNSKVYSTQEIRCTGLKPKTLHTLLVEGAPFTGSISQSGRSITPDKLITDSSGKITFTISIIAVNLKTYKIELTAPNSYATATTAPFNAGRVNGSSSGRAGEVFTGKQGTGSGR